MACGLLGGAGAQPVPSEPPVSGASSCGRTDAASGPRAGRDRATGNAELNAALRTLAARPGGPQVLVAGHSQRGTPLLALHFRSGAADAAAASVRPAVLLVGQQHGDEPAGAEALLTLADALCTGVHDDWLEHIDIVLLPRLNPDGAAREQRHAADGIDINRDHLLLRTPEARAAAALAERFSPLLVVDLHEFHLDPRYLQQFGAMPRADLLLQPATVPNLVPGIGAAAEAWFRLPLVQALADARLDSDWYRREASGPGDLRLAMGSQQPDTLRNVHGLRHAVAFLLESRSDGPGSTTLQHRVHSHLTALRSLLRSAAERAVALSAARERAAVAVSSAACRGEIVVLAAQTPARRALALVDPSSGLQRSVDIAWSTALQLRPLIVRPRPCAYWIAADAADMVPRLRWLGLRVDALRAPRRLVLEDWQERLMLTTEPGERWVQVELRGNEREAAAGGWIVPLDQPLAHLAVALLEPDTPFSGYAAGLLPQLSSAARVMLPLGTSGEASSAPAASPAASPAPR